jgi:hypothetical protein
MSLEFEAYFWFNILVNNKKASRHTENKTDRNKKGEIQHEGNQRIAGKRRRVNSKNQRIKNKTSDKLRRKRLC